MVEQMNVIAAKIQTVDEIYRLVWTAIAQRQAIRAVYKDRPRLFCPHSLGRNRANQLRVLCYQYGGESESGLAEMVPGPPVAWWKPISMRKTQGVDCRTEEGRVRERGPVSAGTGSRPFARE